MKKPLWFKAKTYGWGWTPATWQGWMVIAIFALIMVINAMRLQSHPVWFAGESIVLALILVVTSYLTGESPRWQWGKSSH
jgi:hypothetical protein